MMILIPLLFVLSILGQKISQAEFNLADSQINFISDPDFSQLSKSNNWCPHCQKATPSWLEFQNEFADGLEDEYKLFVRKVECTKNEALCESQGLSGFPSFKFFVDGKFIKEQDVEDQKYKPTLLGFENFISDMIKEHILPIESKERPFKLKKNIEVEDDTLEKNMVILNSLAKNDLPSGTIGDGTVGYLTDSNFDKEITVGSYLVMFHAPWCGHCKTLAPVMEDLAPRIQSNRIKIVKVDCTTESSTCAKFEIKGFPTLKFFTDSELLETYKGERTVDAMKTFVLSFQINNLFIPVKSVDLGSVITTNEITHFYLINPKKNRGIENKKELEVVRKVSKVVRSKGNFYVSPDFKSFDFFFHNADQKDLDALKTLYDTEGIFLALEDNGLKKSVFRIFKSSSTQTDNQQLAFKFDLTNLKKFVLDHSTPLVIPISNDNSELILGNEEVIVVLGVFDSRVDFTSPLKTLKDAARTFKGDLVVDGINGKRKVMFGWLDGHIWKSYVGRVFGYKPADIPRYLILDPKDDLYYDSKIDGVLFEFTQSEVLKNLGLAAMRSKDLKANFTIGTMHYIGKTVGKIFEPYARFINTNPILSIFLFIGFTLSLLYYLLSDMQDDGYDRLKEPKMD